MNLLTVEQVATLLQISPAMHMANHPGMETRIIAPLSICYSSGHYSSTIIAVPHVDQ